MPNEVPSGWRAAKLPDVADITAGINKPKSAMGSGRLYVTVQDLYTGTAIPVEELGRIEVSDKEARTRSLQPGDIVFGKSSVKRSGIGYPSQFLGASEPVVFSGFTYRARAKKTVADSAFLFQALRWQQTRDWLVAYSQASALTNINQGIADAIPVLLPPLPEQKKIAAILSSVDEAIAATQAVIEQTRRVKEGLLQDLLTRGIGHTRFKQTEIGEIPESWEVLSLQSACSAVIDYRGKSPPKAASGIPLLTAKNIRRGFVQAKPQEFIDLSSWEAWMTRGIPEIGDVMFTTEAPLGMAAAYPGGKIAVAQRLITFRPRSTADKRFFLWVLLSPGFQERLRRKATGSTALGIKGATLRKLKVALPPPAEQMQIADVLEALQRREEVEETILQRHQQVKNGLLQDLLTGKVRVAV